ncbi:MAG: dipicolinate synthase subunit B [Firmicutes bacterium]|nr:dipicolinate synthase subunit B [Bacillota bacterium]
MKNKRLGLCITGSFCTLKSVLQVATNLSQHNKVTPILSYNVRDFDTRFFAANDFRKQLKIATKCDTIIDTIVDAEPIGPNKPFDIMLVAPCTGNTLAKMAHGIVDTPVLMAVKAHTRNDLPVVLAVATNDALSHAGQNLGKLLDTRYHYFVPMGQDDPKQKPRSMVADLSLVESTLDYALKSKQIQPLLI